jgi:ATP-dependent DNA ligase
VTLEIPLTIQPMEAAPVKDLPAGQRWLFEPKYDGFRCVLFRDGDSVNLQSRRQRPLGRYFPEIIEAAHRLPIKQFVFDGELIIPDQPYDTLQFRLHPAASRVQLLSRQHPAPSGDTARSWLKRLGHGLDGIVAKRLDLP